MATIYVQLQGVSTASGGITPVRVVGLTEPDPNTHQVLPIVMVSDASNFNSMPSQLVIYGTWRDGQIATAVTDGLITTKFFKVGTISAGTPLYVANGGGVSTSPGIIPQIIGSCVGGTNSSDVVVETSGTGGGSTGHGILSGVVPPGPGIGLDGDFYINTATNMIYGPKAAGIWPGGVSMTGPTGPVGPVGPVGPAGTQMIYGAVAPILEGNNGDTYIDTATSMLYGPKAAGVWPVGTALVGPTGLTGSAGAAGNTVLYGAVAPVAEGVNGNFYIDTVTSILYGPKAGGVWPAGVSLVGPTGLTGAAGKTVLNGVVAPVAEGVDGDFYINTATSTLYGPKAAGVWPAGTSLIGPTGPTGPAANPLVSVSTAYVAAHTLAAGDSAVLVVMDATGGPLTVTVPLEATVSLPIGFTCRVMNLVGGNATTVAPEIGTSLIKGTALSTVLTGAGSLATLIKVSINEWVIYGDI